MIAYGLLFRLVGALPPEARRINSHTTREWANFLTCADQSDSVKCTKIVWDEIKNELAQFCSRFDIFNGSGS